VLPNDNVSMSVGHLDHVLIVYSWMEHVTWKSPWFHVWLHELVESCIPIHAHRCLPDPKCLFYPSGLSLCLSVDHFRLVPSMTWFCSTAWSVMADLWVTLLSLAVEARVCVYQLWKSPLLSCVPWSSDQTSCLSLKHKSWSSSCKGHDTSNWSSLHPWPCPSDEPQSSLAFGEDG